MSDFSYSLTTFSRTGKLMQIEYALNAVSNGRTSLGIASKTGVVIATDKKMGSTLIDSSNISKLSSITKHCGYVYSGLGPDQRVLVSNARKSAATYKTTYGEDIPLGMLVKETAAVMQEYTQSGGVRPFGVSILGAGWDEVDGYGLYQVDPSGAYFGWKASAIGKNYINAKTFLEKRFNEEMELEDAIHTALLTLREGFEGEMNENNIEVGVVTKEDGFRVLTKEEVRDYLDEAN